MSTRVAPIFPVADIDAALSYYRGLGFGVRRWRGGGYGFVTFDGVEIHLGVDADLAAGARPRAMAYLFVEDADALKEPQGVGRTGRRARPAERPERHRDRFSWRKRLYDCCRQRRL